ncbi:isoleucine--tRNA ligase [Candidatus Lariskella endosymbiont of Hedychridium roseum]|uniref:isoleucine--tRNA ligase n=1 Tax=Candidatus Lariskella endosymbiont of Hedychridium roseum TaxID=3077949 RepID=UPI0030D089BE
MSQTTYKQVDPNPNFSDIEKKILDKWRKEKSFERSVVGDKEYVFYDGPPFANGLPHYGHLLTGFIKDIFARYHTMLGERVERRFGWDCHGLPAEMASEKELGISGKLAIEEYGIDQFNAHCRTSVMRYTKEWEAYVERQARWVDFANDYKTMEMPYMESVIWAFKTLYEKGLIYQAMRVMPYSWACQTPVSDFETRMDNSYRRKESKAVTVLFKIKDAIKAICKNDQNCYFVVWTTTPWTLPSNLAIALGADIDYVILEKEGALYIIAEALMSKYANELGDNIVKKCKGSDLIGIHYEPLFDYFKDRTNAFVSLAADFVTTEDGTGIVHVAPGFGEDDQALCKENHIEIVCPVDSAGKFIFPVIDYLGMQVFEANDPIIIALKKKNLWIKTEQYLHNYPHCWRTDTPLIYKAVPSWYIKVTALKEQMIENNQKINWIPEHIKDGLFGKWLENARDWSISRNRYFGCPIPIWQSDDPKYPHIEVYGSIAQLEEAFGVKIEDLHRPFIDSLVKANPSDPTGKSKLRRMPEVLDCWFESGSMPFAQVHYPFENQEWFNTHAPADFIVEYVAQTRGWFYTLMVLSTALFDRPPFLNCICHGVILGGDGQKLSKRLKNYADPIDVFETLGADAMRWFMASSSVMRGHELLIDQEAASIKEVIRLVIKPLWNAYNFFVLYANIDKIIASTSIASENLLDRYIIAKCQQTLSTIKSSMDKYDTVSACAAAERFLEALNNWYIRRSRSRFWRFEKDDDKISAYNTLYTILTHFCLAIAPLLPMVTEEIYCNLNAEDKTSLHLQKFPIIDESKIDYQLINDMEKVRDACNAALHIRNDLGIRIRQPLAKVTFIGVSSTLFGEELKQLILDEINVKSWENLAEDEISKYADFKLKLNLASIGKRLPGKVQSIIKASKNSEWRIKDNFVEISGEILKQEEFELKLEPKPEWTKNVVALSNSNALVLLDTNITKELEQEGIARDFIRVVQQARKDRNLKVTDRITVQFFTSSQNIIDSIEAWSKYIKEQTLSDSMLFVKSLEENGSIIEINDKPIVLNLL